MCSSGEHSAIHIKNADTGWVTHLHVLLVYMWKPNPSGPLSMVTSLRPFKMVAPPLSPLVDMSDHRRLSFDFEGRYSRMFQ